MMPKSLAISLIVGPFVLHGCSKPAPSTPMSKAEAMVEDDSIKTLSRDDLVAAFGEPNADGYFSDWDNAFWLGVPDDAYGVDSKWLVVNYGEDGLVSNAKIAMD